MEETTHHVPPASPVVSPLPIQSDFVEVDLNSPRPPWGVIDPDLLPPAVAGGLLLPPQNLYPSGSHNGATTAQISADAKVASNLELSKPTAPNRRSHKVDASNPAAIPLSTISAAPSHPRVGPPRGEGQDQISGGVRSLGRPPMMSSAVSSPAYLSVRSADITEAAAKEAFLDFGRRKCYSTAPAKEMTIQDLRHFHTYRYRLETFTEDRSCEWVMEPHADRVRPSNRVNPVVRSTEDKEMPKVSEDERRLRRQTSDTPAGRSVPQAWDVPVTVPRMFHDGEQRMVMPLTSSVQACSSCNGHGRKMCLKCHGTGRAQCIWCNGRGRRMQMEMCQHCYGNGTESCRMCQNSNQQCDGCSGKGRVLTYMRLTVTWKNNVFEFITDHKSEFSSDLFRNVKGEKLVMDEQSKVLGITDFPDPTIIEVSQNALEQHRARFSSCRILRQRQSVERLPLTRVQYCWKEKQLSYFVYGSESKVFIQNYPKKCCCVVM